MITATAISPTIGVSEREQVRSAATQFEALLINEVLKSARPAGSGLFGAGEDSSSAVLGEYGEQAFAQLLSQKGGLGLQPLIVRGLLSRASAPAQAQRESKQPQAEDPTSPAGASVR